MDNVNLYRKLTENIKNKMAKYKEGRSNKDSLNSQLILNISSLCRFFQKREEEKKKEDIEKEKRKLIKEKYEKELDNVHKQMLEQEKKEKPLVKEKSKKKSKIKPKLSEEMQKLKNEKNELENKMKIIEEEEQNALNQTNLDIYIPVNRLPESLRLKLESLNDPKNEEKEKEKDNEKDMSLDGEAINLENSFDLEKVVNLMEDEDADDNMYYTDEGSDMKNPSIKYLSNDDLSISMSLFNKPLDDLDNSDNNLKKSLTKKKRDRVSNCLTFKESEKSSLNYVDSKKEELNLANKDFKDILKPKVIKEIVNDMSYDYIKYMYNVFTKMKEKSNENENEPNKSKSFNFIYQFKSFVLYIGITDKEFYEQWIRGIIYNKNKIDFNEFLECFKKLMNSKLDYTFLKFKFLFHITERENDEYFKKEEINNYFNLLQKCKKIYDPVIQKEIKNKLIPKYKKIFPRSDKVLYNTSNLSLVLEQFFDLK